MIHITLENKYYISLMAESEEELKSIYPAFDNASETSLVFRNAYSLSEV